MLADPVSLMDGFVLNSVWTCNSENIQLRFLNMTTVFGVRFLWAKQVRFSSF
ncbi:hypothetical protein BXY39_1355 [Eilatimonas milleporae]|uniref:Uncharacterized protein n=1 Tax=Eilatimonas milleporae TaxID=911205 RepID=A0A3M0CPK7_9PROT|nr:hypothetical protein BXY39_1355 [Eilatimonas milleporae]